MYSHTYTYFHRNNVKLADLAVIAEAGVSNRLVRLHAPHTFLVISAGESMHRQSQKEEPSAIARQKQAQPPRVTDGWCG